MRFAVANLVNEGYYSIALPELQWVLMLNHWHAVYAEIYGDWRFCPPLADANGEMGNGWARKEPPEIRRLLRLSKNPRRAREGRGPLDF